MKNRVKDLQEKFVQILREENEHADRLAKAASAKHMLIPNQVLSFVQLSPLIDSVNVHKIGSENERTTPITSYMKDFFRLYLRCLIPKETDYVMREVHEGVCGNHSGSRSLVHKLIHARYYWPTMQKDFIAYVKTCNKCQRFDSLIWQPTKELTPMTTPWPFA